jgi:aldehyde dehydrogenase (NAD+)
MALETFEMFIDGAYAPSSSGEWLETDDPYRAAAWARIPRGSKADVDRAVAAAARAMREGPWAKMPGSARGKILRRLGDLVSANAERLAQLEVRDNGKLYNEMIAQLRYHPEWWWYFGGLADKIEGRLIPVDRPDMLTFTRPEPIGVVAALTAWNSPLLFVAQKCAPALAAGCSVVVKPSEHASVSSLAFAELTREAGFPDGVFNVVTGLGEETGKHLVEHPIVAKISFTGSARNGARIYAAAAAGLKRVALELGGKSPNIVFEDCDLEAAVDGTISGIFAAAGQTCVAGSRVLVSNSIKQAFTERLLERMKSVKMGDPMLPDTNLGPIATAAQYSKVKDYIEVARSEGARCIYGGGAAHPDAALPEGRFIEPTIFTDVDNQMRIAREEVFGPILSIIGFDDEDEAVSIANDTEYGLAAGVWTKDMARALRMMRKIKAGMVWINTYRVASFMVPFGGMKASGIGRENGINAIKEYLETKSVWISGQTGSPGNPFIIR